MKVKEIQIYFQIPRSCAYNLMQEKGFPSTKVNGRWEVDEVRLRKWIGHRIKEKEINYGTKKKQR